MKVLNVFWNLNLMDRYYPQFKAIADNVDIMTILYSEGKPREAWYKDFNFQHYKLSTRLPKFNALRMIRGMMVVYNFVNPRHFDLVYSLSGVWLQGWGLSIADFHEKPFVIRMRGDPIEVRTFMRSKIQAYLSKKILEPSFRQATRVVPIIEKFVPRLKTLGVKEVNISDVIPNGINHRKFKWSFQGEFGGFTPAYIGRISEEKGSRFLHKLIKECQTMGMRFNLAGEIQDKKFVPTPNCWYLGRIPYEEIQDVYKMSSCILLPSFYEGLSNILLEAYASGRPVIMSPEAIPDEIEVHGFKVERDIEKWKRAINDLRNKNLANDIGIKAHEYSKQFSWDAYGKAMVKEFKKAIEDYYA